LSFCEGLRPAALSPEQEKMEQDAARLYEQGWSI
jgi:hypothetical protein